MLFSGVCEAIPATHHGWNSCMRSVEVIAIFIYTDVDEGVAVGRYMLEMEKVDHGY
jgi:hypothetical protein